MGRWSFFLAPRKQRTRRLSILTVLHSGVPRAQAVAMSPLQVQFEGRDITATTAMALTRISRTWCERCRNRPQQVLW